MSSIYSTERLSKNMTVVKKPPIGKTRDDTLQKSQKQQKNKSYAISPQSNKLNESGPIKIRIKKVRVGKKSDKESAPPRKRRKKSKNSTLNQAIKKKYNKPNHLRRNIRKILKEDELDDAIRNAHKAEMERLKRISEKEKISDVIPPLREPIPEESPKSLDLSFSPCNNQEFPIPPLDFDCHLSTAAPNYNNLPPVLHQPYIPPITSLESKLSTDHFKLNRGISNDSLADLINESVAPALDFHSFKSEIDNNCHDEGAPSFYQSVDFKSGNSSNDAILVEDSDEDEDEMPNLSKDGAEFDNFDDDYRNDLLNVPDEQGRFLINRGHLEDESDFFLNSNIAQYIKPHQISGIRFLYDNVVESAELFGKTPGFGCILAHCMGLGKTIQVVSFLDILFRCVNARSALLVVPINTIQNWQAEFDMWLPSASPKTDPSGLADNSAHLSTSNNDHSDPISNGEAHLLPEQMLTESSNQSQHDNSNCSRSFILHVIGESTKSMESRHQVICKWKSEGGVLLIGYEMFRLLVNKHTGHQKKSKKSSIKRISSLNDFNFPPFDQESNSKKVLDPHLEERKAHMFKDFHDALIDPGPQIIICDEGHRIKNSEASISKALKSIKTKRRVVMTGYPLQNNLIEYWCMVDFVRPNYLGSKAHFINMFQRPIENGQCQDSTPEDRKLMQGRAHILHELLNGFVQRRSQAVLKASLPEKEELVLLVKMSPQQRALYSAMMDSLQSARSGLIAIDSGVNANWIGTNTLKTYAVCCKIWNHPDILWRAAHEHRNDTFDDTFDFDIEESVSNSPLSASAHSNKAFPNSRLSKQQGRNKKNNSAPLQIFHDMPNLIQSELEYSTPTPPPPSNVISYEWTHKANLWPSYKPLVEEHGAKIPILLSLIEGSVEADDKILVFSQSLLTLDILETFLKQTRLPSRLMSELSAVGETSQQYWNKNKTYYRLDGSTSASERERLIQNFNQLTNPAKLFLLSTRAGCLGVNLVGANRVIVLDASWNPCHDSQAVCRVYRYGQKKRCYIYRLVTDNTMEKKIYDRQVAKQSVSDRVVDESNPDQHLMRSDVEQLLQYEDKDLPSLSDLDLQSSQFQIITDPVLIQTLHKYKHWVTKMPFSHESLLIDRKDYRLTRTEKKLARERFNLENKHSIGGMSRRSYGSQATPFLPAVHPFLNGPREDNFFGMPMSRGAISPPNPLSMSSSLADLLSSVDADSDHDHSTLSRVNSSCKISQMTSSQDQKFPDSPSGPLKSPVNFQVIRQTVVSKDFILTTGPVSQGSSTNRRRLFKGETLELVNTPKGKCIRLPRTGEIFLSNNQTNSLISDWSEQKSKPSNVFNPFTQLPSQASKANTLSDLLREDSDSASTLSKPDSFLPETSNLNENPSLKGDNLFGTAPKMFDLGVMKTSMRPPSIQDSSDFPSMQNNRIASCCTCYGAFFKTHFCNCACHNSPGSQIQPPENSVPDRTITSSYNQDVFPNMFGMFPNATMNSPYNNYSPGSSRFLNLPYNHSHAAGFSNCDNFFESLNDINLDSVSSDNNDDIFAPLSPNLPYMKKNLTDSSVPIDFMDLTS